MYRLICMHFPPPLLLICIVPYFPARPEILSWFVNICTVPTCIANTLQVGKEEKHCPVSFKSNNFSYDALTFICYLFWRRIKGFPQHLWVTKSQNCVLNQNHITESQGWRAVSLGSLCEEYSQLQFFCAYSCLIFIPLGFVVVAVFSLHSFGGWGWSKTKICITSDGSWLIAFAQFVPHAILVNSIGQCYM